jgi:hypothetical protein
VSAMRKLVNNSLDMKLTYDDLADKMTKIAEEKIFKNLNSAMIGDIQAVTRYFAQIFISHSFMENIKIEFEREAELKKMISGSNSNEINEGIYK